MPTSRTILGPGILSAALILSSCGSPNPRAQTVITTKQVGVTAMAVAPASSASSSLATTHSDVGGAALEHRSGASSGADVDAA